MKKIMLLLLVFGITAAGAFGASYSHNLGFGAYSFSLIENNVFTSEGGVGATYRYVYYPNDVGFYYGADISMAFPSYSFSVTSSTYSMGASPYSSALFAMMPFGYRWAGTDQKVGFFLGGGPAISTLYGYGANTIGAFGINGELGVETNRTENMGFHFSLQAGWTPLVLRQNTGLVTGNGFTSSIRFGMSWRRMKAAGDMAG